MSDWPKVLPDDAALNPATKTCVVCHRAVGELHSYECRSVGRRVRVIYSFEVEAVIPFQTTNEELRAYRNGPEWCAVSAWPEIAAASHATGCPCAIFEVVSVEDVSREPVQAPGQQTEPVALRYAFRRHRTPSGTELN